MDKPIVVLLVILLMFITVSAAFLLVSISKIPTKTGVIQSTYFIKSQEGGASSSSSSVSVPPLSGTQELSEQQLLTEKNLPRGTESEQFAEEQFLRERRRDREEHDRSENAQENDEVIVQPPAQPPPSSEEEQEVEEDQEPQAPAVLFSDSFTSATEPCLNDGATFGSWTVVFAGYGCVSSDGNVLHASPQISTSSSETHAALVSGPSFSSSFIYELTLKTETQLRENAPPNPWEVAWVIWHYTDNDHFYYFIPKPNGWELGKKDPAYPGGQRFLATGSNILFPINQEYIVEIIQEGTTMTISVDDTTLVTFTDTETPYTSGAIALYTEDAAVTFDDVVVNTLADAQ